MRMLRADNHVYNYSMNNNNSIKLFRELGCLNHKIFLSAKVDTSTGVRFPGPYATEASTAAVVSKEFAVESWRISNSE